MALASVYGRELRRLPLVLALVAVIGLDAASLPASASTRPVGRCGDMAGKGGDTLRIAIGKAVDGDIVDLASLPLTCTTITLTGGEIPIAVDTLSIVSPRTVIVDGNNAGRIFNHSGTGNLYVRYLTLTHGNAGTGNGGCVVSGGKVTLSHSMVTACQTSGRGGGLIAQNCLAVYSAIDANLAGLGAGLQCSADATFVHSSVSGNLLGGGVRAGSVEAYYSTFSHNAAQFAAGGGISAFGPVKLVSSTVSGNSAGDFGGVYAHGDLNAEGSVIAGNTSDNVVGGLGSDAGSVTLTDSTVSDNHALGSIGGVGTNNSLIVVRSTIDANTSNLSLGGAWALFATITNSTISGNRSPAAAGLYASTTLQIANSTVAFNIASGTTENSVGGIFANNVTMASTIVANNRTGGPGAADVHIEGSAPFLPGSSLIMSSNRSTLSITADPQLAPLGFHGGPVRTHALSTGSPAINAGANSGNVATDQRGSGYQRVVGAAADIGAYERQADDDELFYSGFD